MSTCRLTSRFLASPRSGARRFRNDALYGDVATAGAGEFAQLLRDVAWLLGRLATELERATPPQQ